MHSLEYIDDYFKGDFSPKEKMEFEKKLAEDPNFADDVAFYISTRQVSKDLVIEEKKNNFKRIYADYNKEAKVIPMRRIWSYSAAAAVFTGLIVSWFFFMRPDTPRQMAEHYIQQNFKNLGVNMGAKADSIQMGIGLYNKEQYQASAEIFEDILKRNPVDDRALLNGGIAFLQLKKYDEAIERFSRLSKIKLYSNPGLLLQAISLMERSGHKDTDAAKLILEDIVSKNLEGKEQAEQWLRKF